MARRQFDLKSLLDIPLWEAVQDQLALLTGTAIITVDFKGIPITKHSCRTEFCSIIRENPISRKRCYKCDALAGLEAVRLERPYIYLCHCGIVDAAVPVIVGDKYLGAVMFGQVRIPNNDTGGKVEHLVSEISSFQPESETARKDLLEMYNRLPEMEYKSIAEIAELISSIVNYIVVRAVKSQNETETYEWLLNMDTTKQGNVDGEITEMQQLKSAVAPQTVAVSYSSGVYPAISYIGSHVKDSITMKEMASLCHLSPSYFSRLFQREVGESFSSYLARQKVEVAKEMLQNSNKSVGQIAYEVGYIDSSNFIALFKRFEGVTPLIYRQRRYK